MNTSNTAAASTSFDALLRECAEREASDLHLSTGSPAFFRLQGRLECRGEVWDAQGMDQLAKAILTERQQTVFDQSRAVDLAYSLDSGDRFRVNFFHEKGQIAIAVRRLDDRIRDYEALLLPGSLKRLPDLADGLVVVTGPTGSGKTTTLAATLDRINQERYQHIITLEDPIEYLHPSKRCLVHQRELYTDVPTFHEGIRHALREDPDILLVGEMRDTETIKAAITAAETGHLVFSTLHTPDAVGAVNRVLGGFSADEQRLLRHQLSMVLRAVIAQRLVITRDRRHRVPVVEILWITKPVANHIRTGRVEQIYSLMETGQQQGMQTRERSLADLVSSGHIGLEDALGLAREERGVINLLRMETPRAQGRVAV